MYMFTGVSSIKIHLSTNLVLADKFVELDDLFVVDNDGEFVDVGENGALPRTRLLDNS
jgi:hypothetical protein